MRKALLILCIVMSALVTRGQISTVDSLKLELLNAEHDSSRFKLLARLGWYYAEIKTDSALYFFNLARSIADQNKKPLSLAYALEGTGYCLYKLNAYGQGLEALNEGLRLANSSTSPDNSWMIFENLRPEKLQMNILSGLHGTMGDLMKLTDNREQMLFHYNEAKRLATLINDFELLASMESSLGAVHLEDGELDSALYREQLAARLSIDNDHQRYICNIFNIISRIYLEKGKRDSAKIFMHASLAEAEAQENYTGKLQAYKSLTAFFIDQDNGDSSLYYALRSLEEINTVDREKHLGTAYENLFKAYALNKELDSAYKYQGLALTTKDSLYNAKIKMLSEFQNLSFGEKLRVQQMEQEKVISQGRVRTYALMAGTTAILLLAAVFYRSSRQQRKAHNEVKKAYAELRNTQTQLVQREKMASLGELTAGIAHEIQNPLNFVNNFSEVNAELSEEILQALKDGKTEEAKMLAEDIRVNQLKIREHGKRADSIVRSMLQHSRNSTGQKEPTDINALVDEFVRLSYHGMKAKNKSLRAECKTQLSTIVGRVNVIPQEIGRVILNLVNNALYAVDEKAKKSPPAFKPEVLVSLVRTGNKVEIKVKDNGNGIPEHLRDKIFQPFFTTKPTGEGTGLGLSLSYDIITKTHGGELIMDTTEGKGTTFTIVLPA